MNDSQPWAHSTEPDLDRVRQNASNMRNLTKDECIEEYAGKISGITSLLVVSANVTMADGRSYDQGNRQSSLLSNDTTLHIAMDWRLNSDWMCIAWSSYGTRSRYTCTHEFLETHAGNWTLSVHQKDPNLTLWTKVDYCLSLKDSPNMRDRCILRVSKLILGLVTVLNMVKCICIMQTIGLHNQIRPVGTKKSSRGAGAGAVLETLARALQRVIKPKSSPNTAAPYLVTVGDAIASFLEEDDPHTRRHQFATKRDFAHKAFWHTGQTSSELSPARWYRAASLTRWMVTVFL